MKVTTLSTEFADDGKCYVKLNMVCCSVAEVGDLIEWLTAAQLAMTKWQELRHEPDSPAATNGETMR